MHLIKYRYVKWKRRKRRCISFSSNTNSCMPSVESWQKENEGDNHSHQSFFIILIFCRQKERKKEAGRQSMQRISTKYEYAGYVKLQRKSFKSDIMCRMYVNCYVKSKWARLDNTHGIQRNLARHVLRTTSYIHCTRTFPFRCRMPEWCMPRVHHPHDHESKR